MLDGAFQDRMAKQTTAMRTTCPRASAPEPQLAHDSVLLDVFQLQNMQLHLAPLCGPRRRSAQTWPTPILEDPQEGTGYTSPIVVQILANSAMHGRLAGDGQLLGRGSHGNGRHERQSHGWLDRAAFMPFITIC